MVSPDRPFGLIRVNGTSTVYAALFPHANWRDLEATATTESGTLYADRDWVRFAGANASAYLGMNLPPDTAMYWMGSLITEQQDASGLLYRRNRYYDPASGKFTQPDPIGINGGLNTYGFANGDPINASDPLGLCPECLVLEGAELGGEVGSLLPGIGTVVGTVIGGTIGAVVGWYGGALLNEKIGNGSTGGPSAGRKATRGQRQGARDRNRAANGGELRCGYCNIETPEEPGQSNSSEIDHVQPRNPRDGGPQGNNDPENLKNSCRTCNRAKSNNRIIPSGGSGL